MTPPLTPFRQIFSEKKFDEILRKILQDRHRRHIRFARQGDPPGRGFVYIRSQNVRYEKEKIFLKKYEKRIYFFVGI